MNEKVIPLRCRVPEGDLHSCTQYKGGEHMDYQVNMFNVLGIEPDYVRLNQAMLNDQLVEVPGAIRVINIPDED